MEHVFTLRPSHDGISEEERTRRSRQGKSFSKSSSNDRESKRPSGDKDAFPRLDRTFSSQVKSGDKPHQGPNQRSHQGPSGMAFSTIEEVDKPKATNESGKSVASEKAASKVEATIATPSKGKSETKDPVICEVWAANFEEEFAKMLKVAKSSKYIAVDTEFPGFVREGRSEADDPIEVRNYAALRENVNTLMLIQLGLAFADNSGEFGMEGANCCCWQFNFKFNIHIDKYSRDSIQMLTAANVDWERHRREGISVVQFGDKLNASGMVKMIKNMGIKWISFQGGYDFAFMLKLLTLWRMPETLEGFVSDLDEYFPHRCDLKVQLQLSKSVGLSALAKQYDVQRYGQPHQAGSDALLTCSCFFKLDQQIRYNAFNPADSSRRRGALFGLVSDTLVSFGRGYNGSRKLHASHDSNKENYYGSTHRQNDCGDMLWTKRQVVNTLLRLAHEPEHAVANAANKALSLIQENLGDSDVSEHLKDLAMAHRIEAAQKQAAAKAEYQRQVSTRRWDNPTGGIPQRIPGNFVPMMQYAAPMMDPRQHLQYTMQAPFSYDGRYHEPWFRPFGTSLGFF